MTVRIAILLLSYSFYPVEQFLDPFSKFLDPERLGKIIACACTHGNDAAVGISQGRDNEDARLLEVGLGA